MSNNITRWNPFRELAAMQSAMDRIFEDTWRDLRPGMLDSNMPIDVHETDEAYTVVADLPGVTSDQINVNIHDGVLTIAVEIAQPEVDENTRVLAQERFFGKLTRRFSLPHKVDTDNVEATYDNGVLTLTLPKAPEAQPRKISIKAGNLLKSRN
ncbi:MAG: Hsp20/alpha crystallin family protein [Chloroflexota bacterium]